MKTQMELGFESRNPQVRRHSSRRRVPGARWWFQQMHLMVDQAFDWTAPHARPEQIYLSLRPARRNHVPPQTLRTSMPEVTA